jgi:hypothetical protein
VRQCPFRHQDPEVVYRRIIFYIRWFFFFPMYPFLSSFFPFLSLFLLYYCYWGRSGLNGYYYNYNTMPILYIPKPSRVPAASGCINYYLGKFSGVKLNALLYDTYMIHTYFEEQL